MNGSSIEDLLSNYTDFDDPTPFLNYLRDNIDLVPNDPNLVMLALDRVSSNLSVWNEIIDLLLSKISSTRDMMESLLIHDSDRHLASTFAILMKHNCPGDVDSTFLDVALRYESDDVSEYLIYHGADIPELNMPLSERIQIALMIVNPQVAIPQLFANLSKSNQEKIISLFSLNRSNGNLFNLLSPELIFEILAKVID